MSNYFVDPDASGANDGSSWTDAWTTIQTAFDTVASGDHVYCRGTETIAASIDVDTTSVAVSAAKIHFWGCNADGIIDGTRYIIDANSTADHCLLIADKDGYTIQHFEGRNALDTAFGVTDTDYAYYWTFINCIARSSLHGFSRENGTSKGFRRACFFDCHAIDCTSYGWNYCLESHWYGCSVSGGTYGFYIGSYSSICSSFGYDMANWGFRIHGINVSMYHCVSDGAAQGLYIGSASYYGFCVGNRITNNTTGFYGSVATYTTKDLYNYFNGNDTDIGTNMNDLQNNHLDDRIWCRRFDGVDGSVYTNNAAITQFPFTVGGWFNCDDSSSEGTLFWCGNKDVGVGQICLGFSVVSY